MPEGVKGRVWLSSVAAGVGRSDSLTGVRFPITGERCWETPATGRGEGEGVSTRTCESGVKGVESICVGYGVLMTLWGVTSVPRVLFDVMRRMHTLGRLGREMMSGRVGVGGGMPVSSCLVAICAGLDLGGDPWCCGRRYDMAVFVLVSDDGDGKSTTRPTSR